jgi:hypothetical protein
MTGNRTSLSQMMESRATATRSTFDLDKRDRYMQGMQPYHRVAWCQFYDQVRG